MDVLGLVKGSISTDAVVRRSWSLYSHLCCTSQFWNLVWVGTTEVFREIKQFMNTEIKHDLLNNSINPNIHIIDRYIKFVDYCKTINFEGYTEVHHIIPRSFNGPNNQSNLIKLSARHHYIAHLLLAKGTNSPKMIKALHKMIYSSNSKQLRTYKISSRTYAFLRYEHSKIVSVYSKNTVVARQLYTEEIKRIPKALFEKYNGILYEALAKNRKDSPQTILKKQAAGRQPKIVKQGTRGRSVAATIYSYRTPLGFCETGQDLLALYPTFTKNTLTVIDNDVIISNKFASIHTAFRPFVGQSFKEYGIIKLKRKSNVKNTLH